MITDSELLNKLVQLRKNNNDLVITLKKLNQETIATSEKLAELDQKSKELSEFYTEISKTLLMISSELNFLKESSKKKTTKKLNDSSLKKKPKKKITSLKKIEDLPLNEQSKKYKEIIIFLFNEFMKNKDPDDLADENIEDDENQNPKTEK